MRPPRYVVGSCTGYSEVSGKGGAPGTDYYVMDSAYCYRVVATFPNRPNLRPFGDARKRMAEGLAETLNRGDEAWRDALARDEELTA